MVYLNSPLHKHMGYSQLTEQSASISGTVYIQMFIQISRSVNTYFYK
jgi:hypothetical protein